MCGLVPHSYALMAQPAQIQVMHHMRGLGRRLLQCLVPMEEVLMVWPHGGDQARHGWQLLLVKIVAGAGPVMLGTWSACWSLGPTGSIFSYLL